LGCKIYTGYIEMLEIKEKYDIVTILHVLEHTFNPVLFLKKMRTYLKERWNLLCCISEYKISF